MTKKASKPTKTKSKSKLTTKPAKKPAKKAVKKPTKRAQKRLKAGLVIALTPKGPVFGKILGVEIPFDLNDFSTPMWSDVLKFFATWRAEVDWVKYGDPWTIHPYMLEFANLVGRHGVAYEILGDRRYHTADDWIERCFAHFGLGILLQFIEPKPLIQSTLEAQLTSIFSRPTKDN